MILYKTTISEIFYESEYKGDISSVEDPQPPSEVHDWELITTIKCNDFLLHTWKRELK